MEGHADGDADGPVRGLRPAPGNTRLVTAIALTLVVLASASLWYATAPPRGDHDYADRTAQALGTFSSQLVTAQRWSQVIEQDKATTQAATVGIRDAERAAQLQASALEGWNVPPGTPPEMPERALQLADEATALLARMRQAAHDGEWGDVHGAAADVPALDRRVKNMEREVRP